MSDDKTREEFEAWAGHAYSFERQDVIGGYTSVVTQCAFDSWKHQSARIAELEAQVKALRDDAERENVLDSELRLVLEWATTEKKPLREQEIRSIRCALAFGAARAAKG